MERALAQLGKRGCFLFIHVVIACPSFTSAIGRRQHLSPVPASQGILAYGSGSIRHSSVAA